MHIDPLTIVYIVFATSLIIGIVSLLLIGHALNRIARLEAALTPTEEDPHPIKTFIAESQQTQARLIAQDQERRTSGDE